MISSSIILSRDEVMTIEFALRGLTATFDIDLHTRFFDLLFSQTIEEGIREDPEELEGMETRGVQ